MWPFRKPPNDGSFPAPDKALTNPGRELAKMRNPDKRRSYKAFHDQMAEKAGVPPIEWSDG